MSFARKVVLITGSGSGIGAATAFHFAKEGALLALVGRTAKKLEKVVAKMKENVIGCEPLVIVSDISTDYMKIINETIDKFGRLDVLINNASISRTGTIETTTIEDFDAIMFVNARGTFLLTQQAVPHLIKTKGNIVNISTAAIPRPVDNLLAYSMSKAALDQFTRSCAIELAPKGVRVNTIYPGVINTDILDAYGVARGTPEFELLMKIQSSMTALGRVGEPEECVGAIAYLASSDSSYTTGSFLSVDGGYTVQSPTVLVQTKID